MQVSDPVLGQCFQVIDDAPFKHVIGKDYAFSKVSLNELWAKERKKMTHVRKKLAHALGDEGTQVHLRRMVMVTKYLRGFCGITSFMVSKRTHIDPRDSLYYIYLLHAKHFLVLNL